MGLYGSRASNYTRIAASQTDSTISGGDTITVYGITASNNSGSAVQVLIEESDGSTGILDIDVPANDTKVINICFLADNGVDVTTPASTTCTVYHSVGSS